MTDRDISLSDIDSMVGYSDSQKNLMKVFLTTDMDLSLLVDKVLLEALDASDLNHYFEAESLFQEALDLIKVKGKKNDYMFMPVLLHYCAFLAKHGRVNEYKIAFAEFERIGLLYSLS